ncbi:MAG: hypothetical protein AB1416_07375, partial [Actinomycetota bacterium]
ASAGIAAKALAAPAGARLPIRVTAAGKVTFTATVPAARLGRRGAPVLVARGTATARRAGTVTITLRVPAAIRSAMRRLRGVTLTLRVTQAGRTTTRRVRLR